MISRRGFVTSSLAVAASALTVETSNDAQQSATSNATKTSVSLGLGQTTHRLILQKAKKLAANPSYKAFQSGELTTSFRYLFEGMHRVGLTTQVESYIKSNGAPPVTSATVSSGLAAFAKHGVNFPSEVQQKITQHLTQNATAVAKAQTDLINKHGLRTAHRGLHDLMRRMSGGSEVSTQQAASHPMHGETIMPAVLHVDKGFPVMLSDTGEVVGGRPTNPKLLFASLNAAADPSDEIEPMEICNCDGDGGGGDGGGDGDGDGGSDGDGDGGSDGDSDGGDSTTAPGDPSDPDTSESASGTIVYEAMVDVSSLSACQIISSIVALGAGLSASAIATWAEVDAEAAAAFAASLGFVSVAALVACIVGIGAIAAYYAVFC